MSTSGTGLVFIACFVVVVAAAVFSVAPLLEGCVSLRRVPPVSWVLWLVVAVPSLVQLGFPGLYDALYRSAHAVLVEHQWWRVATALVVQDGGVAGTISNLVLLAVALASAVPLWGRLPTVSAFVLVGVALNVFAVLFGAQDGAGNSGATLPLVASLPPFALAVLRRGRLRPLVGVLVTAVASAVLVVSADGHGLAVGVGLLLGLAGMPYARVRVRAGLVPAATAPTAP